MFRHSLWEGPDHLLWVEGAVFQEHYRRFYFKDIEAVVLHQTGRRAVWTFILAAGLFLFAAIAAFSDGIAGFSIFMTVLLAILMVIQWLKGPGCKVHLQTAVQKYRLLNLVRMRKALKVMDRIRASAEGVQGPLGQKAPDSTHFTGMPPETKQGKTAETDENSPHGVGTETAASSGLRLQGVLYGLLLFFGLARGAQYWLKSIPLAVADLVVLMGTLVLAIIVLARMGGRNRGGLPSLSAWLTLAFTVIHGITAYGVFMFATIRAMESSYSDLSLLINYFQLQVEPLPVIEAITVGVALISIGLGLLGLIGVLAERSDLRSLKMRTPQ
jgi:hypothetical protein